MKKQEITANSSAAKAVITTAKMELSTAEDLFLKGYPTIYKLIKENIVPLPGKKLAHYLAALGEKDALEKWVLQHKDTADQPCASGMTPLLEASSKGQLAVVQFLLHNKDLLKINIQATNRLGQTALHVATRKSRADYPHVVAALIKSAVKIDAVDSSGNTALSYTARNSHAQSCAILLERNANPNIVNKPQLFSPLIFAVHQLQFNICKLLLDHAAQVNHKDFQGKTAIYHVAKASLIAHKDKDKDRGQDQVNIVMCDKISKLLINNGASLDLIDTNSKFIFYQKEIHQAKLADAIYQLDLDGLKFLWQSQQIIPNFHRLRHACHQNFPKKIVEFIAKADFLGVDIQIPLFKVVNKEIDIRLLKHFGNLAKYISKEKAKEQNLPVSQFCADLLQNHPESFLTYMLDLRNQQEINDLFRSNLYEATNILQDLRERFYGLEENMQIAANQLADKFYQTTRHSSRVVSKSLTHKAREILEDEPRPSCCEKVMIACFSWVKRVLVEKPIEDNKQL